MEFKFISVFIAFAISNFLYQKITGKKNWWLAADRTFSQLVILAYTYYIIRK